MESDAFALRTALFTLIGALLLGVGWWLLNDKQGEYWPYLVITEESVSGLAVQSRVYYKGVEAGTVVDIFFADNDFDRVQILIHIDRSIPIADNTFARLALRGITGEYDLRLDNEGPLGARLATSDEAPGVIQMHTEYITKISSSIERVLADVSRASAGMATLLNDDNQREFQRLLTNAADASAGLTTVEAQLAPTLRALPGLMAELSVTLAGFRTLAADIDGQTAGAGEAIANLAAAGASIDQLATQLRNTTLDDIGNSLASIDRASAELALLIEDLRQDPQRLLLGAPATALGPGEASRSAPR